ncbi:methyltransferase domain-containing protein [Moorena sp. SIOASIH]
MSDYNQCLSSQYDVVLSFEVLEHLSDPFAAIGDIHSMLKPNGIALIT